MADETGIIINGEIFYGGETSVGGYLAVGLGTLSIGGIVNSDDGYIGYGLPSAGLVRLSSPGTAWNINGNLYVGYDDVGRLDLASGAALNVAGGAGTVILGDKVGTLGTLNIGADAGLPAVGAGTLNAASLVFGPGVGTLRFNHDSSGYLFATSLSGYGTIVQAAGVTQLAGEAGAFTGTVQVTGGTLQVNQQLGASMVEVAAGGALGGAGAIQGAVDVADGGILRQAQGSTLALGSLALAETSQVDVTLGAPDDAMDPLFAVTGDLVLDGELTVTNANDFDFGSYTLFSYGGTLTNNGLTITALPPGFNPGDWAIEAAANVVSLLVAHGAGRQYWDGALMSADNLVGGGDGVWNALGTNWTNSAGSINAQWASERAVFGGATGGTVTVEGSQAFTGLVFETTGYQLAQGAGGALAMAGDTDASVTVSAATAEIGVAITGSAGLVKLGAGELVLTAANGYAGLTTVQSGTLALAGAGSLAASSGVDLKTGASLDVSGIAGTNATLASLAGDGQVQVGAKTLAVGDGSFSGAIEGSGRLAKTGGGTLAFSGSADDLAAVDVQGGTLEVSGGGAIGDATGVNLSAGATLAVQQSETVGALGGAGGTVSVAGGSTLTTHVAVDTSFAGSLAGGGTLVKTGTGTLTLTGSSSHAAGVAAGTVGTTVQQGALALEGGTISHGNANLVVGSVAGQSASVTLAGSTISDRTGIVGNVAGSTGSVTVGAGASWNNASELRVGGAGNGTLVISDGGTVQSTLGYVGFNGGTSSVLVTGAGSTWTNTGRISLAQSGSASGSLTLANGGKVSVDAEDIEAYGVHVGNNSSVNLGAAVGADAEAAGTLEATRMQLRGDTSTLNFNHTDEALEFGTSVYVAAAGSINAYSGTTRLTGEVSGAFAGTGTINVYGGELELAGDNSSFTGNARLYGGKLVLASSNALGVSMFGPTAIEVMGSGTIGLAAGVSLQNSVVLGAAAQIEVASGTATLAGPIGGSHGLAKTGDGTLVLAFSGGNSYLGGTQVLGGTLQGSTATLRGSIELAAADGAATVVFDQAGDGTYLDAISGEGTVRWLGAGELTLAGASSYGGTTEIGNGTLVLAGASAAGSSDIVFSASGSSVLRIGGTVLGNLLTGFGEDDRIDLQALDFDAGEISTSQADGQLTVTQGGTTIVLEFAGLAADAEFLAEADAVDGSTLLNVIRRNDAASLDLDPATEGSGGAASYSEQAEAVRIAPAALVADVDSADFQGGSLTVAVTANASAGDQLAILDEGTAAGQIGLADGVVSYGGAAIGTVTAGAASLVVQFTTAAATPGAVQALVRAIAFANPSDTPATADRGVTFTLVDGDGTAHGGTDTASALATVVVTAENDPPTGGVTIEGDATEDATLTVDTSLLADLDGLGTLAYQWLRGDAEIADATGSSYTLTQDDVGATISVRVSYTDGQGSDESVLGGLTAAVANVDDQPTGEVTVAGTAEQYEVLTASHTLADEDGLGTIAWQWLRDGIAIDGATDDSYALAQDDVGAQISVRASYTDGQGKAESVASAPTAAVANVNDAPTGTVTVSGTAMPSRTLTASYALEDLDGMGPVSFRWMRDGAYIPEATGASYVVQAADLGMEICVEASYMDEGGNAEAMTSAMLVVRAPDEAPVTPPLDIPPGGDGIDTFVLPGNRDQYDIERREDGRFTVQRDDSDAPPAVLQSIERLQFDDRTVNLTAGDVASGIAGEELDALIELYIAYFNRAPESDGLLYWIGQFQDGRTLAQIGESFYAAAIQYPELTGYSDGMSHEEFVTLIYRNALGRETPDAEGLAYWSGQLASGQATRGTLVAAILESAHSFAGDPTWGYVADLLANKIAVGKLYAIEQGLAGNTPEDAIREGMEILQAVTPTDTEAAIALIGISDNLDLY